MTTKNGMMIVLICFAFGNYNVQADELIIESTSLPDNGPSVAPPGADNIRVNTLITLLKTSQDLGDAFIDDLNREDVQLSIAEHNPILFTKFPPNAKLRFKAMEKLAKNIYRYDFFIPKYLRGQESVRKAFKLYARKYYAEFERYLEQGRKYLHEGEGVTLIHPDFFYDSTFTYIFLTTCIQNNYNPHFPPPPFPVMRNQQSPQLQFEENRKRTFYYFYEDKIFNSQQKDLFLKKHPSQFLPEYCYPTDFLNDETFVQAMTKKFPHGNFIEMAFKRKKNPKLKNMYLERIITNTVNDYDYPKSINKLSVEDLESEYVQEWIFSNPEVIKHIEVPIKWNSNQLEKFASVQFKPDRYFTELQKTNPVISELLLKFKNDGPEFLNIAKEMAIKWYEKIKCCGPSYDKGIQNFIAALPPELKTDGTFLITILNKSRMSDNFLRELAKTTALPKELKEYIVNSCKDLWGISRYGTDEAPSFIKEDKTFHEQLKIGCKR